MLYLKSYINKALETSEMASLGKGFWSLQLARSGPSGGENYNHQPSLCLLEVDLVFISAFLCVLLSVVYGVRGVGRGKIKKTNNK